MNDQYTLFIGDLVWRAARVRAGEVTIRDVAFANDATLEARADAARRELAELDYVGQAIVLAPASSWCLSAVIATHDLARGGRRRAMGFGLEEHLPVSAEDMVADFVEHAGEALGVCGEHARLGAVVSALESHEVPVRHICPAALLAAARVSQLHHGMDGVLLHSGAGVDFIELRKEKPARWWWFADDTDELPGRLAAWSGAHSQRARLVTLDPRKPPALNPRTLNEKIELTHAADPGVDEAAAMHAADLLEGDASPWIDLRRDRLATPDQSHVYRKPLGTLAAALACLLICAAVTTWWRGRRYEALGRQYAQQQAEVFRATLPGQRVPGNIAERLASEKRKLAGLGGQMAGGAAAVRPTSALVHLQAVLASLPTDEGFRVLDLGIEPDLIRVEGQARSHADADKISTALRATDRYDVEPPKTRALKDHGVSFVFSARPSVPPLFAKGGEP